MLLSCFAHKYFQGNSWPTFRWVLVDWQLTIGKLATISNCKALVKYRCSIDQHADQYSQKYQWSVDRVSTKRAFCVQSWSLSSLILTTGWLLEARDFAFFLSWKHACVRAKIIVYSYYVLHLKLCLLKKSRHREMIPSFGVVCGGSVREVFDRSNKCLHCYLSYPFSFCGLLFKFLINFCSERMDIFGCLTL